MVRGLLLSLSVCVCMYVVLQLPASQWGVQERECECQQGSGEKVWLVCLSHNDWYDIMMTSSL